MKKCKSCKSEKGLEAFNNDSGRWDGKDNRCRDCSSLRGAELRKSASFRAKYNEKRRKRYAEDAAFYEKSQMARDLRKILRGERRRGRFVKLLGTDTAGLRAWLESGFQEGMTWENYGGVDGWEIDHRKAYREFDLTNEEGKKECYHYTNLQPMWAKENRAKDNRGRAKTHFGKN